VKRTIWPLLFVAVTATLSCAVDDTTRTSGKAPTRPSAGGSGTSTPAASASATPAATPTATASATPAPAGTGAPGGGLEHAGERTPDPVESTLPPLATPPQATPAPQETDAGFATPPQATPAPQVTDGPASPGP